MEAVAFVHEQLTAKKEFPKFKAGDNITVNYKIVEGNKERIQSFKGDPAAQTRVADLWAGCNWWRAVAISILIILFILAFETLGFFLCSFILLLVIMRWLEGLSWKTSILVPVIAIGCTYLLFKTILKISLPAGIFGF